MQILPYRKKVVTERFSEYDIICYGLCSHQISTQLNTCWIIWTDVLNSTLHQHHQNTKINILAFIPTVEFHRIVKSMPRRIKAVLMACDGPTPYEELSRPWLPPRYQVQEYQKLER